MNLPARFVAGNLIWARDGSVWAVYRVEPVSYPWLAVRDKLQLHQRTAGALMALPGPAMVLSLCTPVPATELSRRLDAGAAPGVSSSVSALAARTALDLDPTERRWYLVAERPAPGAVQGVLPLIGTARAALAPAFGLPPQRVTAGEIARRAEQAGRLQGRLRPHLTLAAATAAEVCGVYASSLQRGLPDGGPGDLPDASASVVRGPRLTALADAVVTEGGTRSDPHRPAHRRYLRVETEAGVGYQALLALADLPHRFTFPDGGGEWLVATDAAPFPVDWCLRIRPVAGHAAQASARRQARQLQSQVDEYDGDPAGAPPALAEAIEALAELRTTLSAGSGDREVQVTMILAVGSPDLRELDERAAALKGLLGGVDYSLHRPIGGQVGLFTTMLPGAPARPPARDYRHHLLCRDLAAGMPFAGSAVGDPEGMLLGYCLDAGTFRPVLFDPSAGPGLNRSGSLGAFGALGSGKSYFMKSVVHATLARGGRVVVLDRTASGEYVRLAGVVPGRAEVVRVGAGAAPCLDPLRVFPPGEAATVATGFLTLLTGASPTDPGGVALAEAVRGAASQPGGRMADVLEGLEAAAGSPDAAAVWTSLRSARAHPLAAFAFGEGPPPRLDADYLVFHAPGLSLPERDLVLREHLARRLPPEQVLAQALLYLVAAVARQVTFADPGRFAAALFDEAWSLTASIQGRSLLLDGVRDGRKHNAAVWLVSQHPNDLGDDELTHLLGPRFVFRQARAAAPAALRFAGVEPSERAVDALVAAEEGTCLFRDLRDRVGHIRILPALTQALHEAFETNPLVAGVRPA